MRKKFMAVILAAVMGAALTGCFQGQSICLSEPAAESEAAALPEEDNAGEPEDPTAQRQAEFESFLAEVNAERQAIYDGTEIPLQEGWASDMDNWGEPFDEEEVLALMAQPETLLTLLTAEEAAEDVETAFRLLRQVYAAYDYFGGSAQFDAMQAQILGELNQKMVTVGQLENAMVKWLYAAIADCHFTIGRQSMAQRLGQYPVFADGLYFDDPAGLDPELVKRTIDPEGRIRYTLVKMAAPGNFDAADFPASMEIEGKTVQLQWTAGYGSTLETETAFSSERLQDGTPLLTSRTMGGINGPDAGQQEQLDKMAATGAEYADEPLVIWDFRGNAGGSNTYFIEWFHGWTGQDVDCKLAALHNFHPTAQIVYQSRYGQFLDYISLPEESGWRKEVHPGAFLEHQGLTFVLQDKACASAGESSIGMLRTAENTVTVGCNTFGSLLTGNVAQFYLPNSGLCMTMGMVLQFVETEENRDGIGYLPDLWVPSDKALERVEKMVGYYGLSGI